jgi:hypothetical protein
MATHDVDEAIYLSQLSIWTAAVRRCREGCRWGTSGEA